MLIEGTHRASVWKLHSEEDTPSGVGVVLEITENTPTNLRERSAPFTDIEVQNLIEGVQKFGTGRWNRILKHFEFHPKRTLNDLKVTPMGGY